MILVTGGAGFIGYHLSKYLSRFSPVVCIDNLTEYYARDLKEKRVRNLVSSRNIEFREVDLNDQIGLNRICREYPIEIVINLAAQPGVRLPIDSYKDYVHSNLTGFESLMQVIVTNEIQHVVFASSSSVYGESSEGVLSEEQVNLTPVSYYGATKLCNEVTARIYSKKYGTKIFGLRFFTVYGSWGRPDMAYFRIASAILNNEPFTLFGDGSIVRDFTHIEDVVESIQRLLPVLVKSDSATYEIFNIGGGKPSSMLGLIQEFEFQAGNSLKVQFSGSNNNDVSKTNADWSKLIRYTGYRPELTLAYGVSQTLEWARSVEIAPHLSSWVKSVV